MKTRGLLRNFLLLAPALAVAGIGTASRTDTVAGPGTDSLARKAGDLVRTRDELEHKQKENEALIEKLSKALVFQAQMYSTRFEFAKASACYDTLLFLTPDDPANLHRVAAFRNGRRDFDRAESLETRILSIPSVSDWWRANAHFGLGEIEIGRGRADSARSQFAQCEKIARKLAEWNPDDTGYADLLSRSRKALRASPPSMATSKAGS